MANWLFALWLRSERTDRHSAYLTHSHPHANVASQKPCFFVHWYIREYRIINLHQIHWYRRCLTLLGYCYCTYVAPDPYPTRGHQWSKKPVNVSADERMAFFVHLQHVIDALRACECSKKACCFVHSQFFSTTDAPEYQRTNAFRSHICTVTVTE